jgi:hypothetical protein
MFTHDIVDPKTHDPISHAFQPERSPCIVDHLIAVLSAIDFDNQAGFQAYKVHNIGLNYRLAPELVSH